MSQLEFSNDSFMCVVDSVGVNTKVEACELGWFHTFLIVFCCVYFVCLVTMNKLGVKMCFAVYIIVLCVEPAQTYLFWPFRIACAFTSFITLAICEEGFAPSLWQVPDCLRNKRRKWEFDSLLFLAIISFYPFWQGDPVDFLVIVLHVIREEILRSWWTSFTWYACFIEGLEGLSVPRLLCHFMHAICGYLPFREAIIIHLCWNLSAHGFKSIEPVVCPLGYHREVYRREKEFKKGAGKAIHSKAWRLDYSSVRPRLGTIKLYGYTSVGECVYNFPSNCTYRELDQFRDICVADSREEWEALRKHGVLPVRWFVNFKRICPRVRLPVVTHPCGLFDSFNLDIAEDLSAFASGLVLVTDAFIRRDFRSIALMGVHQASRMKLLSAFFQGDLGRLYDADLEQLATFFSASAEELLKYLPKEAVVALGTFEAGVATLPLEVSKSALMLKVVAFVALWSSVSVSEDSFFARYILRNIRLQNLALGTISTVLIMQIVREVYECYKRFTDTGKIFEVSLDMKFYEDAERLLPAELPSLTAGQLDEHEAELRALLQSRVNLKNSSDISKKMALIQTRIHECVRMRLVGRPRVPPVVIFLEGEPGVGKTAVIDSLINSLRVKHGTEKRMGDVIYYQSEDRYPVESATNTEAEFMVINDIQDDYSKSAKSGLLPLDVALQQIVDSSPLLLPQAFRKGMMYTNLKYVIITSNFDSILFSGDVAKLERRFSTGVCATMHFPAEDYSRLATLTPAQRNDSVRFTLLKSTPTGKRLGFKPTQVSFTGYRSFLQYTIDRVYDSYLENARKNAQFTEDFCKCGIARALHESQTRTGAFSDVCEYIPVGAACTDIVPLGLLTVTQCISYYIGPVYLGYLLFGALHSTFKAMFSWFYLVMAWITISWFQSLNKLPPLIVPSFATIDPYVLRARTLMIEVKTFLHKYRYHISLVLAGIAMYKISQPSQKPAGQIESVSTTRDFSVFSRKTPMHMPTEQVRREWAHSVPVQHATFEKMNVGSEDLKKKISRAFLKGSTEAVVKNASGEEKILRSPSLFAVAISNQTVLINKHYLYFGKDEYPEKGVEVTLNGRMSVVYKEDVFENPESEMVCIHNVFDPSAEDLSSFMYAGPTVPLNATVIHPDKDPISCVVGDHTWDLYGKRYQGYATTGSVDLQVGDCGSALLIESRGSWALGGFLCASSTTVFKTRFCFTKPWYQQILAYGAPSIMLLERIPELVPISNASECLRHGTDMMPLGSDGRPSNTFRSSMKKTAYYDQFYPRLSEPYSWPTKIGGMIDDQYVSAWSHTFVNYNVQGRIPFSKLREATRDFYDDIVAHTPECILRPLTIEEAVAGMNDIGVDKTKMKTSPGIFWKDELGAKKKEDLFTQENGVWTMRPEFEEAVYTRLDALHKGVLFCPLIHAVPKDEVRETRKIDNFKIRLFGVMDADINLVARMYLMPLISLLLANKKASECFGQMNAGSREWTELVDYMDEIREGGYSDGDFNAYDASHPREVIRAVAELFFWLGLHYGYTLEEATVTAWCIEIILVQIWIYKGDFFVKAKGFPSGHVLTLMFNSLVNSILLRLAYYILVGMAFGKFRENVRLATVGDDNFNKISRKILSFFSLIEVAPLYSSWGYKITPASKAGEFTRELPLTSIVFLKRSFVLWDDGLYRAPLAFDSIYKAFAFETKGENGGISRLLQVYEGSLREAYLHGREFYQEHVEFCESIFAGLPVVRISFDDLDQGFKSKGLVSEWC